MARRRLLTILAASAVLSMSLAGPAASVELVESTEEPVEETLDDTEQVAEDVTSAVTEEDAEPAEAVEDPVTEVTEAVAPEPDPDPESEPEGTAPSNPEQSTAASSSGDDLVTAGDVAAAPSLAYLTGTGGSAPAPTQQSRLDLPLSDPAATPVARATDEVPAPQVAAAPTEQGEADDGVASGVAQAAARAAQEQGVPVLVLVAIASLLAAGAGTINEARCVRTARSTASA